uniref:Uncharacterized protein n=1 Tax=Caenorhabditis japonica TaxID=281687 RepID=A0A8R1HM48_CAEJA
MTRPGRVTQQRRRTAKRHPRRDYRDDNLPGPLFPYHPEFTIDLSQAKISEEEKEALTDLLNEFSDTFSKNSYDLGSSKTDPVHIQTSTEVPVKGRPYRVPVKYQAQ